MFRLVARLLYTILLVIESLIAMRFIIKLINANSDNKFVALVLEHSERFVKPFEGIVSNSLSLGNLSIDLNSIVALVFYMIFAFVAIEMIKAFSNS